MAKDNIKALQELRAQKVQALELIQAGIEAEDETRAFTDEENTQIEAIQKEIKSIDTTIERLNEIRAAYKPELAEQGENAEACAEDEARAFADYLRGTVTEERANMTTGDNGAVIPSTIANKIIKKVYDVSPILSRATRYNVKGTLSIPFYPADTNDITMAYADEFVSLTSTTGKFGSIDLKGYLAGVLTLVSRSLINNSQFDIVSFVVDQMAYNVSRWIEQELISGTTDKIAGLSGVTEGITAASATAITADELIGLQDSIKDAFQRNAIWVMNPATRTALRKLKDGNNRYLLQDDITAPFGRTLLGKPVFVSDNMPTMAAGTKAVFYGDMSGLAVKINEALEIQVLRERYADQHAIGVVGWTELDAKIENAQKIAALTMKGA